jgi:uncharacterized delta-60 repeat protein
MKYPVFLFLLIASCSAFGQNVFVDPGFNFTGANNTVDAIDVQADGKILIGGQFTICNGISKNRIFRMHPDGTTDASFNIGSGFNGKVNAIKIQDDGKIIIGGAFTSYNGSLTNRIIRLNTDGTPDPLFNIGSGMNEEVSTLYIQPDGKILVGGFFSDFNGISVPTIIRMNTNGTLDNTFTSSIIERIAFSGFVNSTLSIFPSLIPTSLNYGKLISTNDA